MIVGSPVTGIGSGSTPGQRQDPPLIPLQTVRPYLALTP